MGIPYWTKADQAEFEVLVDALIGASIAHRACVACQTRYRTTGRGWCTPMESAAEAVFDWRRSRALLSRAQALRVEVG